jgi:hypothetical protein
MDLPEILNVEEERSDTRNRSEKETFYIFISFSLINVAIMKTNICKFNIKYEVCK